MVPLKLACRASSELFLLKVISLMLLFISKNNYFYAVNHDDSKQIFIH